MESGGLLRNIVNDLFGKKSNITGLELTTKGTYSQPMFPTINVARSNLKLTDEPEIIAECAYEKMLRKGLIDKNKTYGIIGNGIIGNALNQYLLLKGLSTIIYDNKHDDEDTLNKLKANSDFIIGATGKDCLISYERIKKGCNLISVSSGDIEFNRILKSANIYCDKNNLFSDLCIRGLKVINGGYPITFDLKNGSDNKYFILIYGLWLIGIIQAGLNKNRETEWVELDENYQNIVKNCLNNHCISFHRLWSGFRWNDKRK
jgi:hypothetical protein